MAKETHRAVVIWVCGVPFAVTTGKQVSQLLQLSAALVKLDVKPDGSLATLTKAATHALENQLVSKIELLDVECTDCHDTAETGEEMQVVRTALAEALHRLMRDGSEVAAVKLN